MPIARHRAQIVLTAVALLVAIGAAALVVGPAVFGDDREPSPTISSETAGALDLAAPLGWDGLARGPLLHLGVEPIQPGDNVLTVRVTSAEGEPMSLAAESTVELALTSFAPDASPLVVTAESDGAGGFVTAPTPMSDPGWWAIDVRLNRPGETEIRQPFYLILPDPNAYGNDAVAIPASDAAAEAVYQRGRTTFTGLHRVRYRELMASGGGDVAVIESDISDGTDGRPIATRLETFNAAFVRIGEEGWARTQNGDWLETVPGAFIPPADWDREWVGATGFALGPIQEIAGEPSQIVTFFVPETTLAAAWYAFWVGTETGNVHRVAMISRSHYMISDYRDFDAAFIIEPPVSDAATPAA